MLYLVSLIYHKIAKEKSTIESTRKTNYVILIGIMGKTVRKYQIRDRANKYQRIENHELHDKYYTDVAKSHDRKIKRRGLEEPSEEETEDLGESEE